MRYPSAIAAVSAAALIASGCAGGAKSIKDVKSCLKKVGGMKLESAEKNRKEVKEGVFASHFDTKDPTNVLVAIAADVKSSKDVKKFNKEVKAASKQDKKMKVSSGSDGTYVWMVAGKKGSKFTKAEDCVKS